MPTLLWLRRDLRSDDLPALAAASEWAGGDEVAVCVVLDPAVLDALGATPRAWLAACVMQVRESYQARVSLLWGDPAEVLVDFASQRGVTSVHVTAEPEPQGAARDARVRARLAQAGIDWVETGTPYAVDPGEVLNRTGRPFEVFTPFSRTWRDRVGEPVVAHPDGLRLARALDDPDAWQRLEDHLADPAAADLPPAGEQAAAQRWHEFLSEDLCGYAGDRDRADLDRTSRLSPYLALGVLHPRTLVADLLEVGGEDAERYLTELAWREFYADVTLHHPGSLHADLRPALTGMEYDAAPDHLAAWQQGRTGYPFVDAGMRQLLATGWMHNRVRMVTASFLTKDLHVWWPVGAAWFLQHLIDGDPASNAHGWQWTAGTGTDAAPYFRVFNPVRQGLTHDPRGDYVRRWVPELRHLAGAQVHEPWNVLDGYERGYPEPIVDHATERREALARLARVRAEAQHG